MVKFKVNQEVCIGCGNCANTCPACFEINDEGKSQVKTEECNCDCQPKEVVDECPVKAISLEE
jgi:ferredoxin